MHAPDENGEEEAGWREHRHRPGPAFGDGQWWNGYFRYRGIAATGRMISLAVFECPGGFEPALTTPEGNAPHPSDLLERPQPVRLGRVWGAASLGRPGEVEQTREEAVGETA